MTPFRTPAGGRVSRTERLRFRFDGREYAGYRGDTLASALLANGVHLVGRSFKYHRPRGILSAGVEEPNALVAVHRPEGRSTPNLRATEVALFDGLVAESQNRWPSLRRDVGALNGIASPILNAGFYYKTFMWPRGAWHRVYEPLIRRAAGLGEAPERPDRDRYAQRYAHCEVLVVGAGPAGIAAALAASAGGARVVLCDEGAELGGSLLADRRAGIGGQPAAAWLAEAVRTLAGRSNVRLLPRTTAFGYYPHNLIALNERVTDHLDYPHPGLPRERLWKVRAAEVVLATGAIERPLVFPGNDRPGVMLADAARTYAVRYGVLPGRRAVVATACDSGYRTAMDLAEAGVEVALIADLRHEPGEAAAQAERAGIPVLPGTAPVGTTGGRGGWRVRTVEFARLSRDGVAQGTRTVRCDLLALSGGWTPSIHLQSQSRARPAWDALLGAFVPGTPVQRERSAGACRGRYALADALADGFARGMEAIGAAGYSVETPLIPDVQAEPAPQGWHLGLVPGAAPEKAFVDFQNDVTARDLLLAVQEGFRSIEHVKRYTTTGMATDQGKTSNLNALAVVAERTGQAIPAVGLTTYRTPTTPVTFGSLAGHARGELFDPVRNTPVASWAEARGAVFEDVGLWKRARYFPRPGEGMHQAVARECRTVRASVGLFDASTLGKIEVCGPDAAEFMNRMYTAAWTKLKPGRCRYGIMLRESGFVMDDGVVGRLAEDRFHVTTTTGGAPRVLAVMEDYLQTEWPDLRVWLTSTTEQWGVIAIQGPRARDVVAPLVEGVDLAALPHMGVTECRTARDLGSVPARLFRVSFTGELGYELNVPADYALDAWERAWEGVHAVGGCAYGTETMHVLRAEKGYIIVGQESDGTVTPGDLGLDWAVGKAKRDFVGKRSLVLPDLAASGRPQLVGLLAEDGRALEEGAQVTDRADAPPGTRATGWITSAYEATALGHPVALALVADGRGRHGERAWVQMPDGPVPVRIADPVFYDKQGERLDA